MMKKRIVLNESALKKVISNVVRKILKEGTLDDLDGKEIALQEVTRALQSIPNVINQLMKIQKAVEVMPQLANWYDEYEQELGNPMWPVDNLDVLQNMPSELSSIQDAIGELQGIDVESCLESVKVLSDTVGSTLGKNDYLDSFDKDWYERDFNDGTNSEDYVNGINNEYSTNLERLRIFNR